MKRLSVVLAFTLAATWGSSCDGPEGDRGGFRDGGARVRDGGAGGGGARDGGTLGRDGGAANHGARDAGTSVLDGGGGGGDGTDAVDDGGGGGDAAPSPMADLVTRITIDADAIITEDKKVPARLQLRRSDDDSLVADGIRVGIKIRGHLSLQWPKKNYSVETWDASGQDTDYDFLGMGAMEDWALHGPYVDRSLLHNVVINHLSNQIGRYAPETRLTSLALREPGQSTYRELGVYVLMERIRFSKHRLQGEKTSPDGKKKAFLMQIDWTDSGDPYRTTAQNTPIFFVYPPDKSRTTDDENKALAVMNTFESSLSAPEQALKHIDRDAAADYFILTELARNPDGYRKSYYFHIPVDGLITFGPIWDYDLAFGISQWDDATNVEGWQYEHNEARYFRQLLQASTFRQLIKARWQQLRQTTLSDAAFEGVVRAYVTKLGPRLIAANNERWPVSGQQIFGLSPDMTKLTTYDQVVEHLIDYGQRRMQWIDLQVQRW